MGKLLVEGSKDPIFTSIGSRIAENLKVQHPVASIVLDSARTVWKEVKDGVKSTVILTAALIKEARYLVFELGLNPSFVASVYLDSLKTLLSSLECHSILVDTKDENVISAVALTALNGATIDAAREHLCKLVVKAATTLSKNDKGLVMNRLDDLSIVGKVGGSLLESEFIDGLVLEKRVWHSSMPRVVKNARIALIDASIEVPRGKIRIPYVVRLGSGIGIPDFYRERFELLESRVEAIKRSGANVVFCRGTIDDEALYLFGRRGIMAVRLVDRSDLARLAKSTGASITADPTLLSHEQLGFASLVEQRDVGDATMILVRGVKDSSGSCSILLRASSYQQKEEAAAAIRSSMANIAILMEDRMVVPGGGCIEMRVSRDLEKYAYRGDKRQLCVLALSKALQRIPLLLAASAGLDPHETVSKLRSYAEYGQNYGVNVLKREIVDVWKEGIIEPMRIKRQVYSTAVETAASILRIDYYIAAGKRRLSEAKISESALEKFRKEEKEVYLSYGKDW